MRSVIESEMPLIVAIQHSKSGMFSNFHFTCFEWIIHNKLFRSPSFDLKNLCAAGTEEGPILLISKLTQSIVPVCLLCVHKRKVTNIMMSHQINTFLSVSADGSIAGWHCSDGSCCFAYDNLVPPGEIQIVLCDSDASLAWFWTLGECASLIDLKRGNVIQKIDFVGISSFSILKKLSNFLSDSTSPNQKQNASSITPSYAIMVGVNSMRTYEIDEKTNLLKCQKVEEISFVLGQKRCITPNGIVIYKNRLFQIYLPNINVPVYSENISDISDDDMISHITWRNFETLLVSSMKGFFKIYKIQIQSIGNSKRIGVQKIINFSYLNNYIFSNVALNNDMGVVIFAATKRSAKSKSFAKKLSLNQSAVICLSTDSQKVVKLVLPQIEKICCIPNPNSRIIIQAEQHSSTFQIFDWGLSTSISHSHGNKSNSNISIDCDEYKNSISKSFINSQNHQSLKPISSSEIRSYSLFGKQLPISQSVDFRPNNQPISSSFLLREGSFGSRNKAAYITAICSQNFNNLSSRLQIIVGASDGKLYFFWENNLLPFEVSEALVSPIIAIIIFPIRFTKASCLVAVGRDGSFCLFKWNKMSHRYVTNNLPVISIGVIETQRLIVVQKSDNSFTVYNLNSPEPIGKMLFPPPRTVIIWSCVNFSKPTGIQSTLSLQIGGSSLFYSVLEVSKLRKLKRQRKSTNSIPIPSKSGNSILYPNFTQPSKVKEDVNQNSNDKNITNNNSVKKESPNIKTANKISSLNKKENSNIKLNPIINTKSFSYHNFNPNESEKAAIAKNKEKGNILNPIESINSDFKALVNSYVDSNSNSDSLPNSDSNNDLQSKENSSSVPKETVPKVPTGDINSISNNSSPNDINQDSDNILLNDTVVSNQFSDSLVKLLGPRKSHVSIKTLPNNNNNETIKDENICDPISQTGKFTISDIRSIVSVVLDMMMPSLSSGNSSVHNSRLFRSSSSIHPNVGINSTSSTESNKLFNIDENQDGLSFVLVGHRNLPTFFYPMFKLTGPTVLDTSPFNAALHYLSYKIMSNFLNLIQNTEKFEKENKFKICGFISILTQFLFINDLEIQKISALTCNKIVNWSSSGIVVPEHVWNFLVASYIQYFDKNDVADYDKFLMAIMMVTHSDLVDPIYHRLVFDFLIKMAKEKCPSNFLAFNILLSNFEFWIQFKSKKTNDSDNSNNNNNNSDDCKREKKEMMVFLLSTFFVYEKEEKDLVKEKLYSVINGNFNSFCESIRFILFNHPSSNYVSSTCQICSEVSEEYPRSIGTLGPLFIAYLAVPFSQFQDIFYNSLKVIQKKFQNEIDYQEQIWLFATNDGFIRAFKNMKFFFKEKITEGPILAISIGPGALFAAAITRNDPTLIKIDLKSSMFLSFSKKRVVDSVKIEVQKGFTVDNMKIEWESRNSCHVQYYLS